MVLKKKIFQLSTEPGPASGQVFTPVAPGTRIISSNVIQSTTSKMQLAPGVYKIKNLEGTETVLIVKDDRPKTILPKEIHQNIYLHWVFLSVWVL